LVLYKYGCYTLLIVKKLVSVSILACFLITGQMGPCPVYAQDFSLPAPGQMVALSPQFEPALIRGLVVHRDNPFLFDFIVDPGQSKLSGQVLKQESDRMIKYFFASLTIPDKDIWVNLSPYEKNRMIPQALGQTIMGRDLLAQDYMLKQLSASLIYPQKNLGKIFWDRIYTKAKQLYGTTEIPVNTFNKVWIVPQKVGIYEHGQTVFIVDGHLKVLLEEDYLSLTKHVAISNWATHHTIASDIIRQLILPEIEKEVNNGKNFAILRQIFYAQALAVWFKRNIKQALLNRVYANKGTVKGIDQNNAATNEEIFQQYLKAYKKGVFNYIKNDLDPTTQEKMPRKYFSGGYAPEDITFGTESLQQAEPAMMGAEKDGAMEINVIATDPAMIGEAQIHDVIPGSWVYRDESIRMTQQAFRQAVSSFEYEGKAGPRIFYLNPVVTYMYARAIEKQGAKEAAVVKSILRNLTKSMDEFDSSRLPTADERVLIGQAVEIVRTYANRHGFPFRDFSEDVRFVDQKMPREDARGNWDPLVRKVYISSSVASSNLIRNTIVHESFHGITGGVPLMWLNEAATDFVSAQAILEWGDENLIGVNPTSHVFAKSRREGVDLKAKSEKEGANIFAGGYPELVLFMEGIRKSLGENDFHRFLLEYWDGNWPAIIEILRSKKISLEKMEGVESQWKKVYQKPIVPALFREFLISTSRTLFGRDFEKLIDYDAAMRVEMSTLTIAAVLLLTRNAWAQRDHVSPTLERMSYKINGENITFSQTHGIFEIRRWTEDKLVKIPLINVYQFDLGKKPSLTEFYIDGKTIGPKEKRPFKSAEFGTECRAILNLLHLALEKERVLAKKDKLNKYLNELKPFQSVPDAAMSESNMKESLMVPTVLVAIAAIVMASYDIAGKVSGYQIFQKNEELTKFDNDQEDLSPGVKRIIEFISGKLADETKPDDFKFVTSAGDKKINLPVSVYEGDKLMFKAAPLEAPSRIRLDELDFRGEKTIASIDVTLDSDRKTIDVPFGSWKEPHMWKIVEVKEGGNVNHRIYVSDDKYSGYEWRPSVHVFLIKSVQHLQDEAARAKRLRAHKKSVGPIIGPDLRPLRDFTKIDFVATLMTPEKLLKILGKDLKGTNITMPVKGSPVGKLNELMRDPKLRNVLLRIIPSKGVMIPRPLINKMSNKFLVRAIYWPNSSITVAQGHNQAIDKAMRGGIDLSQQDSALHVSKDANGGVQVNVDPALIARVEREGLAEVDPIIIGMRRANVQALFGVVNLQ